MFLLVLAPLFLPMVAPPFLPVVAPPFLPTLAAFNVQSAEGVAAGCGWVALWTLSAREGAAGLLLVGGLRFD